MTDTALHFGVPADGATEASDSEFLAAVHWRSSNPGISSELSSDSDVRALGMCWKHHCLSLNWPKGLERRFRTLDELPLDESAGSLTLCLATVRETSSLKKKQKTAAAELLDEWLASNSEALTDPLVLLACCDLLIFHAEQLPAATVGRLWRAALCGALDLSESFEKATSNEDWDEQAVDIEDSSREWVTGGLLPWACGLLFDEVKGAPKVAKAARSAIHKQLESVAVDEGCPDGTVLDGLPFLLATLHDTALIGHLFDRPVWKPSAQRSWLTLLKNSAALLAADGHLAIEAADPSRGAQLVASASTLSETAGAWSALATKLASPKAAGSKKKPSKKTPTPPQKKVRRRDIPSWQSDEAEVACLRTTWDESASIASITHHGDLPFLELAADGVTLLRGDWGLTVAEDGEVLEFEPAWENVCWHSEPEVDYCELQFEFEGGPRICRHVMLSRQHQFAIVSDIVTETSAKELEWETRLPLANGVSARAQSETREQLLKTGSKTARVFPLVLPQDLRDGAAGAIGISENDDGKFLALRCPSSSGALFAPIVIDWSQENRKSPAEWKQLTTTTAGEIDLIGSAAYRLQFGKRHLMLYRSLVKTKRYRAMVGYQTDQETILADFKDGEIDEIVMVE